VLARRRESTLHSETKPPGGALCQAQNTFKGGHLLAGFSYAWDRWLSQKLQVGTTERPRESRPFTRTGWIHVS